MVIRVDSKIEKEKIIAFFFSIAQFLTIYKVPGIGINAAYFPLMFLSFFYVLIAKKRYQEKILTRYLFFFMAIYILLNQVLVSRSIIYDASRTNIISIISFFMYIFLFTCSFGKSEKLVTYYIGFVENISIFMSFVVIVQCVLYYIFGTSITYDRSFILPLKAFFNEGTIKYLETSQMVINGIFRPSAFFLEPAHFSQYCSIGLASLLLKKNSLLNKRAIVVSVGMILTTSGLGIGCVFSLWMVFLLIKGRKLTVEKITKICFGFLLGILLFVVVFLISQSFRSAIIRVFVPSNGYNSGIEGRLWSRSFVESLTGKDLIFGMGFKNIPVYGVNKTAYYMTGVVEMLYCQGVVGILIFSVLYIWMIIRSKRTWQEVAMIILVLFIPFFIGSACLNAITLCCYIPFLFEHAREEKTYKEITSL